MKTIALILVAAAIGCGSSLVSGPCSLAIVDGSLRRLPRRRQVATAAGGAVVLAVALGSFCGFVAISLLPITRLRVVRIGIGIGAALVVLGVASLARVAGAG